MSDEVKFDERTGMEVAIVGMAARFPGADSIERFWENLRQGIEALEGVSAEELEAAGRPKSLLESKGYVPVARPIRDFDHFDAGFFEIGAREAELMDPQHRIFLECAWEALEDAGYDPERCGESVGVFAGSRMNAYLLNVVSNPGLAEQVGELTIQLANDKDYLPSRVSYKLDLGGPSVNVQSACSTALVAVHLGSQALIAGECELVLAGGVALRYPNLGYWFQQGGVQSPDGHVRAFDAGAQGTMFGNGMGAVVLKRLEDALADGDTVHAVVRGSAVTNDGSARVGFAAPGVDGQVRVVRAAQLAAGVDAESITFVEAHGTGTPMGDPIEVQALTRVFRETTAERGFCALGSVKTNIGHAGAAAGIAGLIKATLAIEHAEIPPTLFFETPNPQIDLEASPFFVNTDLRPWKVPGRPRRAAVSSFGMGGTNAHVILEQAPPQEPSGPSRPWQLLVLSARSESALAASAARLADHLESHPETPLADAAHTLQVGRRRHAHRRTLVCRDRDEAVAALRGERPERVASTFDPETGRPVVFLFSGQGSQYPGMGRDLYESEKVFRVALDRCAEGLRGHLGGQGTPEVDLRELLYPEGDEEEAVARLEQTAFTQPALFAVEYALAELWTSWGIEPRAMIGHSIGEYAAACRAGVFSLEDALALVAARGRLMQALPAGSMLAVPLPEAEVVELLDGGLSLAAVNAPERCVVSGPADAVERLADRLAERSVPCRPLHTSHAFHSPMMEPILEPFVARLDGVELRAPEIPFVSNLTGTWITAEQATDPAYWARHLRQAVRFADGLATLLGDEPRVALLEVGPGNSLGRLASRHPARGEATPILSSLRHPRESGDDRAYLLRSLGRLWAAGVDVDWPGFYSEERRRRVPLPTYPFERQRYWLEIGEGAIGRDGAMVKKENPGDWFYLPTWEPSVAPAPRPGAAGDEAEKAAGAPWILFDLGTALGGRLAERLTEDGRRVIRVGRGGGFRKVADDDYEVGGERADYQALLEAVGESAGAPRSVIHLWSVEAPEQGDRLAACAAAQERGFWSLMHLAAALPSGSASSGGDGGGPLRLLVATAGMQRVAGEQGGGPPDAATVLGPVKVIPQENPGVRAAAVDLEPEAVERPTPELLDALLAEVGAGLPDGVLALRAGERWVRGYVQTHLPPPRAGGGRLREAGVYLITGGLGGFGLTFAEHLAREHRARLVLVGRTPLPAPAERDAWLAEHGADDRTARKILAVRGLEEAGAEVVVEAADVADPEAMGNVVRRVVERFGELNGVVHAAGVPGGGMIRLKSREAAEAVLAPKVRGTLALEAALEAALEDGADLDFLMLCSSTLGIVGPFGQVDYTAANAFLEAYAHAAAGREARYTVAVDWCAWGEVGMAVETKLPPGLARGSRGETAPAETSTGVASKPAASPAEPEAEPLHPLIDRLEEEGADRWVFVTRFRPERHFVLDEHRILGTPTIPGTTWVEMARAAFERIEGPGPVDVEDLLFFTPVLVADGESRDVRLTLERDGAGLRFAVTTAAPAGPGEEPASQKHAQGRLARGAEAAPAIDLEELLAGREAREVPEMKPDSAAAENRLVSWGPRWHCLREVYTGDGEGITVLELPEEFASDLDELGIHPTLLDVGTALGAVALEQETYLPLSYRRIHVRGPLPRKVFSHLRKTGGGGGSETLRFDVTFYDAEGRERVAVEGFNLKKAGDAGRRLGARPAGAEAAREAVAGGGGDAPAAAGEGTLFGADGISRGEGIEVFERVLSWGRHPQMAVNPRDFLEIIARVRAVDLSEVGEQAGGRAAAGSANRRPDLDSEYVEPEGEIEETLAALWRRTLNLDRVGARDSFFDLGGDSIVAINLIAGMAKEGYDFTPDQLFEHQTIAELAEIARGEGGKRPPAEIWRTWCEEQAVGPWAADLDHWLAEGREGAVRLAGSLTGEGAGGGREELRRELDARTSEDLEDRALPELRASLEEVVLASLALAVRRLHGGDRLVVELAGDGRRAAPEELGLTDAEAALPYSFPALFELAGVDAAGAAEVVRDVKEQRRRVPSAGASFEALRDLAADRSTRERLSALGRPDLALRIGADATQEGAAPPPLALVVVPPVAGSALRLDWSFVSGAVDRQAVEVLDGALRDALQEIVEACREAEAVAVSATDFPEAGLSQEDLDKVLGSL